MIICLNGPPSSGKTTASKILQQKYGVKAIELARPFKKFVADCLGMDMQFCDDNKDNTDVLSGLKGRDNITIRELQIAVASTIENADPCIWIKMAMTNPELTHKQHYVIDAIGKKAQWEWLVENFGPRLVLWRIDDQDETKYWTREIFTDMREAIGWMQGYKVFYSQKIINAHPKDRNEVTYKDYYRGICNNWNRLEEMIERIGQ